MTAFAVLKKQKSNEANHCSLLVIEVDLKQHVENYKVSNRFQVKLFH